MHPLYSANELQQRSLRSAGELSQNAEKRIALLAWLGAGAKRFTSGLAENRKRRKGRAERKRVREREREREREKRSVVAISNSSNQMHGRKGKGADIRSSSS